MEIDRHKLDTLVGRLFGDLSAGYGGVMVSLGDKLGFVQGRVEGDLDRFKHFIEDREYATDAGLTAPVTHRVEGNRS